MEASEAREQLEMVDRIIASSSQRLCAGGEFFVVWGIVGAAIDALVTAVNARVLPGQAMWAYPVLLVVAIAFSVVRTRQYRARGDRMSILQREYLNVLWLAISLTVVVMFTTFNIFTTVVAVASLWSFAEAIVLFYIGMHGNRRAQIGGIIVLASLVLANFTSPYGGWVLAAGVLLGYAGFGVAELTARD